jgi:hypothetical protein
VRCALAALASVLLAGCGAEPAGTAATGAAIKKKELEQGEKIHERARQTIEQAADAMHRRAQQAGGAEPR